MAREYAKLTQNDMADLESTNYVVKPTEKRKSSCCLTAFITLGVVVMLCGGIAIVTGIFFMPQMNKLIQSYQNPGNGNETDETDASLSNNITSKVLVETELESNVTPDVTTLPPVVIGRDKVQNETRAELGDASIGNSTEMVPTTTRESYEYDEEDGYPKLKLGPRKQIYHRGPAILDEPPNRETKNETSDDELVNMVEERFASWMMKLERGLENVSGLHRPEFVVPLFMLLCFFGIIALASCCCCLITKRREARRRRLIGKIITDLQSGDSKAVLLDRDDDD